MGMYTEFVISTRIVNDPAVVEILKWMTADDPAWNPPPLPDHPFFQCGRWSHLFKASSHYFVPLSAAVFEYNDIADTWCLIGRCDLKNYDHEIAHFVDWLRPYLDSDHKMFAYSRYEESEFPILYYGSGATHLQVDVGGLIPEDASE